MDKTSVSKHYVLSRESIYHSFLDNKYSQLIEEAYEESEKIPNVGYVKDNLINTERTDWHVHRENKKANQVWNAVAGVFHDIFFKEMKPPGEAEVTLGLISSWIAVSNEKSFVAPHLHSSSPFVWSYSFYAKIPNLKSSLNFFSTGLENVKVNVREGDVLLFPSTMQHYSNDVFPGRTIFSGNFSVMVNQA